MDVEEIFNRLVNSIETGLFDILRLVLRYDFTFSSNQILQSLTADEWIQVNLAWLKAFADLKYNFKIEKVADNRIHFSTRIEGTHTGCLDLAIFGIPPNPASNKTILLDPEHGVVELKGAKILRIQIISDVNSGILGMCKQLDIYAPLLLSVKNRKP